MRLSLKLAAGLMLAITTVLAAYGAIRLRREAALFEQVIRRDHQQIGNSLALVLAETWSTGGERQARALLRQIDSLKDHLDIRWSSGGQPGSRVTRSGSGPALLATLVPVVVQGRRVGAVELTESLAERQSYLVQTTVRTGAVILILAGVSSVLALGLGYVLVGRPVGLLVRKARQIARGSYDGELRVGQRDELGVLAQEMRAMSDSLAEARRRTAAETAARVRALEQLRHADRLRMVGTLAAGVAHELGSPLCVVNGRAALIASGVIPPDEIAANARIIGAQAERMAGIVRQLLSFARRQPSAKAMHDLCELVAATIALLESEGHKLGVALRLVTPDEPVPAFVDVSQIQQVLMNLLMNAVQATARGGSVEVAVNQHALDGSARPCVRVTDTGSGMTSQVQERLFEPFFTTKDVGQGTGLGLSVSHGIVEEHGGRIAVESAPGQGSRFTVYLAAPPAEQPELVAAASGPEREGADDVPESGTLEA